MIPKIILIPDIDDSEDMDITNFTAEENSTLRNTVHVPCNICLEPSRHCKCNKNTPQLAENTSQIKQKDRLSQTKRPNNEKSLLDTEIPKFTGLILMLDKKSEKPKENKSTHDQIEKIMKTKTNLRNQKRVI